MDSKCDFLAKILAGIVGEYAPFSMTYNVRDLATITSSQFKKKAASNAITAGDKPRLLYETMQLYEKCEPATDLKIFINLFLDGGSNVTKIMAKAGPSAAAVIRTKCSAYGIEYGTARSKNLIDEDLTLSRIVRAFPVETATEILKKQCRGILTSKFFKNELPLVMQHTIFPGLIPVYGGRAWTQKLHDIAVILNMEISFILGSPEEKEKMKKRSVEDLVWSSKRFVEGARKLNDYPAKCKILIEAGVLTAKGDREFELSAAATALWNELPDIRVVYHQTYSNAVRQLNRRVVFVFLDIDSV